MIVVHNIFVCKPGNASKLAKLFKEWADIKKEKNTSVMTDMTGEFHRVIITETHQSLAAYEEAQKDMGQSPEEKAMMEKFKDMNEMYVSGTREIFKVW
jgi:2-keto-3-deoxy-galactonokinase